MKSGKDIRATANRLVRIGDFLQSIRRPVEPDRSARYQLLGIRLYGVGCRAQEEVVGVKTPVLFQVRTGDVVYNKMWASKGAFAVVGKAFDGYLVTSEYPVFRPSGNADAEFIGHLLAQPRFWRRCDDLSSGTTSRSRLNPNEFLAMRVRCPPLPEQRRIAAALASVGAAIAKTRDVIERVEKARDGVMGQLFLHGLPGKRSQVRATRLGMVPDTWQLVDVGSLLASCDYGLSCELHEGEEGVPCARMGDVKGGRVALDPTAMKRVHVTQAEARPYLLKRGDLLFNRTNSRELVGKTGIVRDCLGDAVFASYLVRLRVTPDNCSAWLGFYLNHPANLERLRRQATPGVQQWNINASQLRRHLIPRPPIEEQDAIAAAGESFDRRLAAERTCLARLEDTKRALAQALLSGQPRE